DIWRIPGSGGEATQITNDLSDDFRPRWSPDGQQIAYVSRIGPNQSEIRTVVIASGQVTVVTETPSENDMPAWSPSGNFLVYTSKRSGNWDLWMREFAAGVPRTIPPVQVSLNERFDTGPTFLGTDTGLIFASTREGDLDIWLMSFFVPLSKK
ncbi:PD40 domain-containing protein, partial [candidate division KSB1 bacterium]|nr:PD40 domain-containing protein [candidate division KSB1 bacterium]